MLTSLCSLATWHKIRCRKLLDFSAPRADNEGMAQNTIQVGRSTFSVAHVINRIAQIRALADHYERTGQTDLARQGRNVADGLEGRVA